MYLRDFFMILTLSMVAVATPRGVARRDYVLLDAVPWTIRSFNRSCSALAGLPTTCYYGFWVDTTQDEFATLGPPSCAFGVQGPETASWNSLACSSSYNVSWGYQDSNDGAVLTVVSDETIAWFGLSEVSKTSQFGDVGPSPVYGCDGQLC